jgi:DNA-binding NarL/FixJ family response regulator
MAQAQMAAQGPIFVISPSAETRRAFVDALEGAGFFVRAAALASEDLAEDVALLFVDLALSDIDSIDYLRRMRRHRPDVPIVGIGARTEDARVIAAFSAGAHGCIFADDPRERLVASVHEALDGGRPMSRGMAPLLAEHIRTSRRLSSSTMPAVRPLTERERVVLCEMARGHSYEDIGRVLGVTVNTVRTYVRSLYEKLHVNSRTEAVLLGIKLGVVRAPSYPPAKPRG